MKERRVKGPKEVFESLYRSLGRRQNQAIFAELLKTALIRPALTVSRLVAYVTAALVHLITLACLVLSVLVLAWAWPDFWKILILAVPCFWLTWTLRPRLPKHPRSTVDREEYPALYEFVDSVAVVLGSPPVDGIVINEQFNASIGRTGWERKRILTLGLPLWLILDKHERVALVAHELAHTVNGDPNRGLIVGSAVHTLARWHSFLRPARILDVPPGTGLLGLLMIPFNIIMFCLSTLPWAVGYALIHLLWRDSQRAEYLSDHLAAGVSGSSGMISLLEKAYFGPTFFEIVKRRAHSQDRNVKLFEEFTRSAAETSQEELERMRNEDREEGGRLDIAHPPTAYRMELLERKGPTYHMVSHLDWSDEIEEAFQVQARRMQGRLLGEYRLHL